MSPKIISSQKNVFRFKGFWVQKKGFLPKKILIPKNSAQKILGPKKFVLKKILVQKFWVSNILEKNFGSTKI